MSNPTSKERLARLFHDTYERLAPRFGYETRKETRSFDPTTPNGQLMIAVCGEIFDRTNAEFERLTAELAIQDEAANILTRQLRETTAERDRLRAALEELMKDEWRCTVDWGPREERHAILERCERALGLRTAHETAAVPCKHDFQEYSIDNARNPLDPPELVKWVKCIKCGARP